MEATARARPTRRLVGLGGLRRGISIESAIYTPGCAEALRKLFGVDPDRDFAGCGQQGCVLVQPAKGKRAARAIKLTADAQEVNAARFIQALGKKRPESFPKIFAIHRLGPSFSACLERVSIGERPVEVFAIVREDLNSVRAGVLQLMHDVGDDDEDTVDLIVRDLSRLARDAETMLHDTMGDLESFMQLRDEQREIWSALDVGQPEIINALGHSFLDLIEWAFDNNVLINDAKPVNLGVRVGKKPALVLRDFGLLEPYGWDAASAPPVGTLAGLDLDVGDTADGVEA